MLCGDPVAGLLRIGFFKRAMAPGTTLAGTGTRYKSSWSRSNAGVSRNNNRYRNFFMVKSQSFPTRVHPPFPAFVTDQPGAFEGGFFKRLKEYPRSG